MRDRTKTEGRMIASRVVFFFDGLGASLVLVSVYRTTQTLYEEGARAELSMAYSFCSAMTSPKHTRRSRAGESREQRAAASSTYILPDDPRRTPGVHFTRLYFALVRTSDGNVA